ncbi:MAG: hypothetical protein RXR02_01440 [Thermoproteus sp.]
MARALGYGLLATGVVLIAAAVFMVYAALAGYVEPFHIFSFSDVVASYGSVQVKVIEGSRLSKMADLSFWALLAAFVASAGGKLADLGVKLIASER